MLNLSEEAVVQTRLDKPDAYAFRLLIAMSVLCFLLLQCLVGFYLDLGVHWALGMRANPVFRKQGGLHIRLYLTRLCAEDIKKKGCCIRHGQGAALNASHKSMRTGLRDLETCRRRTTWEC